MNWTDLAGTLARTGAPVLGGILGGPAGAALGSTVGGILASALGVEATPGAVADAIEKDPALAGRLATVEAQHAAAIAQGEAAIIAAIGATQRQEAQSEHWPQWLWRPLFGFAYALSFAGLVGAIAFAALTADTAVLNGLADLAGLLLTLFSMGAAVLGAAVWRRSDEKIAGVAGKRH